MVDDMGSSFGSGLNILSIGKMSLKSWEAKTVWNRLMEADEQRRRGRALCIGNVTSSPSAGEEGLENPVISEAGRKFLADLLSKLTDQQIRDIFRVARVSRLHKASGKRVGNSEDVVDEWTAVFKEKRNEILERSCPEN